MWSAKVTRNGRVRNYEEGLRAPVARFCSRRGNGIEPSSPALRLLIVRGQFRTDVVNFDLVHNGGTISPGQSLGNTAVIGQLQLNSGILEIDLASPASFDTVTATLSALLGGDLHVRLASGFMPGKADTFEIITGQTVSGTFANLSAGNRVQIDGTSASLLVTISNSHVTLSSFLTNVPGDYNNDGIVDTSDYVTWRKGLGTTYTNNDYDVWRAHYGSVNGSGSGNSAFAVTPEPAALVLLSVGFSALALASRPRGIRSAVC